MPASRGATSPTGTALAGQPALQRWLYLMQTRATVLLGAMLMRLGLRTAHTDWGRYKQVLARNTDVRKVNDCFRQIIAGTPIHQSARLPAS